MYFISKKKKKNEEVFENYWNYFDMILFQWSNDDTQYTQERNILKCNSLKNWSMVSICARRTTLKIVLTFVNERNIQLHLVISGLRNTVWCILISSMRISPFHWVQHNYDWVLERKRIFHFWTWKYSQYAIKCMIICHSLALCQLLQSARFVYPLIPERNEWIWKFSTEFYYYDFQLRISYLECVFLASPNQFKFFAFYVSPSLVCFSIFALNKGIISKWRKETKWRREEPNVSSEWMERNEKKWLKINGFVDKRLH